MLDVRLDRPNSANLLPAPDRVWLAAVSHPGVYRYGERWHLLGIFTGKKWAREVAEILYPGWTLDLSRVRVRRTQDDV